MEEERERGREREREEKGREGRGGINHSERRGAAQW